MRVFHLTLEALESVHIRQLLLPLLLPLRVELGKLLGLQLVVVLLLLIAVNVDASASIGLVLDAHLGNALRQILDALVDFVGDVDFLHEAVKPVLLLAHENVRDVLAPDLVAVLLHACLVPSLILAEGLAAVVADDFALADKLVERLLRLAALVLRVPEHWDLVQHVLHTPHLIVRHQHVEHENDGAPGLEAPNQKLLGVVGVDALCEIGDLHKALLSKAFVSRREHRDTRRLRREVDSVKIRRFQLLVRGIDLLHAKLEPHFVHLPELDLTACGVQIQRNPIRRLFRECRLGLFCFEAARINVKIPMSIGLKIGTRQLLVGPNRICHPLDVVDIPADSLSALLCDFFIQFWVIQPDPRGAKDFNPHFNLA
mmetsp:Transcript_29730/g.61076  ORF Transcript_29730/g.61076 Transcript_29730/m.61076 type:complete len:371 (-) Transcript_29730:745-1857(-)